MQNDRSFKLEDIPICSLPESLGIILMGLLGLVAFSALLGLLLGIVFGTFRLALYWVDVKPMLEVLIC